MLLLISKRPEYLSILKKVHNQITGLGVKVGGRHYAESLFNHINHCDSWSFQL